MGVWYHRVEANDDGASAITEAGDVTAETIEDLERAIDLVLYGVVRPLRALRELVGPLEVHGQLVLDRADPAFRRSSESISRHLAF